MMIVRDEWNESAAAFAIGHGGKGHKSMAEKGLANTVGSSGTSKATATNLWSTQQTGALAVRAEVEVVDHGEEELVV